MGGKKVWAGILSLMEMRGVKIEMSLPLDLGPPCQVCLCLATISLLVRWEVETHRGIIAGKQPPLCEER